MTNYSELLTRLRSLIDDDTNEDNIYRQASHAIECLLSEHNKPPSSKEPTDHEAEGAMRYVMSRVPVGKLSPRILMMQSAENWRAVNGADRLYGA